MSFVIQFLFLTCCLLTTAAYAGATYDGSMGTAGAVSGNFTVPAAAGKVSGNNLFHSFSQFDVLAGESATFTGNAAMQNVLLRVSGGQPSTINGAIDTATAMPQANFYFLNPAGIIFGSAASVNIGGALHVSTADYLRMADTTMFNSKPTTGEVLSLAAPSAFGFVAGNAGAIVANGSSLNSNGGDITLSANNITLAASSLTSNGGAIGLFTTATTSEALLATAGLGGTGTSGTITMQNSNLDSSALAAGRMVIRGGQLLMDGSTIIADSSAASGAGIQIDVASAQLGNSTVQSGNTGLATGGDIQITAGSMSLSASDISSSAGGIAGIGNNLIIGSAVGNSGDIRLTVGSLNLASSVILTSATGTGIAGDLTILGSQLNLPASNINSSNLTNFSQAGAAGNLDIRLSDSVNLVVGSSIKSNAEYGRGGNIVLNATRLLQLDYSEVSTFSTFGLGLGGTISIDPLLIILNGSSITTRYTNVASLTPSSGSILNLSGSFLIQLNSSVISSASALNIVINGSSGLGFSSIVETITNNSNVKPHPPGAIYTRQNKVRWGQQPCWIQGSSSQGNLVVSRLDAATTVDDWVGSPIPTLQPLSLPPVKLSTMFHLDGQDPLFTPQAGAIWMQCII